MRTLLGSPGPWPTVHSPWWLCGAQTACWLWKPGTGGFQVRHGPALRLPGLLGREGGSEPWVRESACVAALHPPSGLSAPPPFCHMSLALDYLERWLLLTVFNASTPVIPSSPHNAPGQQASPHSSIFSPQTQ